MEQPPLDSHYVVMHLGGAKQVRRQRDGPSLDTIAEMGSLTFVPAGTAFHWRTSGPIAFAHLYVKQRQLEDTISTQFERDGDGVSLIDRVGCCDPLLQRLFHAMVGEVESAEFASALLLDSLLDSFLVRLARVYASRAIAGRSRPVALAPHRLRRVLDFIDAHLGENIRLDDLACAAGSSQFHFSHGFRKATGYSPYHYLIQQRIEYAKVLLIAGTEPLSIIASQCGFNSQRQFSVMFKELNGIGPKRFRILRRSHRRGRNFPAAPLDA
ncbi:MAG: helix-turn-helix domain-containing protein [Burkholderiaceae bacterium]